MSWKIKTRNLFDPSGVCNGMADLAASTWSLAEDETALVSAVQAGSDQAFDRPAGHSVPSSAQA